MEKIQVLVRPRNFLNANKFEKSKIKINLDSNSINCYQYENDLKTYNFDKCLPIEINNHDIYEENLKILVSGVIKGIDNTIFVYGQTSSGKTYTIKGDNNNNGIFQYSIKDLFKKIKKNHNSNMNFKVEMSYSEIYNEQIYDLLNNWKINNKPLQIIENKENNKFEIKNGKKVEIKNYEEAIKYFNYGEKNRHYANTKLNHNSSRSHTIITIIVKTFLNNDNSIVIIKQGLLNFVDLAGSEKLNNYNYENNEVKVRNSRSKSPLSQYNKNFNESKYINKSLFYLTQVIYLKSKYMNKKEKFIPYRNSLLTKLLKNSLGGNSRTFLILCIISKIPKNIEYHNSMDNSISIKDLKEKYMEYTISSLRFGKSAKNIENKVQENIIGNINSEFLNKFIKESENKNLLLSKENEALKVENFKLKKKLEKMEKLKSITPSNDNNKNLNRIVSYNSGILFLNKDNKKYKIFNKLDNLKYEDFISKITSIYFPNNVNFKNFNRNFKNNFSDLKKHFNIIIDNLTMKFNKIINLVNSQNKDNFNILKNIIDEKNLKISNLKNNVLFLNEGFQIENFTNEYLDDSYKKVKEIYKKLKNEIIMREIIKKINHENKTKSTDKPGNELYHKFLTEINKEKKKWNSLEKNLYLKINIEEYMKNIKKSLNSNLEEIYINYKKSNNTISNILENYKSSFIDINIKFEKINNLNFININNISNNIIINKPMILDSNIFNAKKQMISINK